MKRALHIVFAVGMLALVAFAAENLSPSKVLADREKLHEKEVTVIGKVAEFKQRTSRAGNKYVTLKLKEGDKEVNVYMQGELKPAVKDGDKVRVKGIFRKEKKLRDFTVKDEIDATPLKDKEKGKDYGIKAVE